LDDIYQFNRNNTLSRTDSLVKCDDIDLNPITSNLFAPLNNSAWLVDSSFTAMIIALGPFYTYEWKIKTLTENLLEIEQEKSNFFGTKLFYTYQFIPVR